MNGLLSVPGAGRTLTFFSGVSFLPKEDDQHSYEQAPYEVCTADDLKGYPKLREIDWDSVDEYQLKETEFACSASGGL